MHPSAFRSISKFYFDYKTLIDQSRVADIGALNINGATKDIIGHAVGFDIVSGNGVDVVIKPGEIPAEYIGGFGVVVSTSSFMCCPDPILYKKQILDLLKPEGLLLLTMCSDKCEWQHTTSKNEYGFKDEFRMSRDELIEFFSIEFDILEFIETNYEHPDFVIVAKLKTKEGQKNKLLIPDFKKPLGRFARFKRKIFG